MRKKLKTSSRKPENVIKFGASQVGKIYGKAAKEHRNSLKHVVRTMCCSQPWHRPGYNHLGVRQHCLVASGILRGSRKLQAVMQ